MKEFRKNNEVTERCCNEHRITGHKVLGEKERHRSQQINVTR